MGGIYSATLGTGIHTVSRLSEDNEVGEERESMISSFDAHCKYINELSPQIYKIYFKIYLMRRT